MKISRENIFPKSTPIKDKGTISALYIEYYDRLLHYGLRLNPNETITEECIQEMFVEIIESNRDLEKVQSLAAYLFTILRRRIFEKLNIEKKLKDRRMRSTTDIQITLDDVVFSSKSELKTREILIESLNKLSWRQRESIYLRYYNGLNTNEIAEIMGAANQTILNTLYQGLQKLRKSVKMSVFLLPVMALIHIVEQ